MKLSRSLIAAVALVAAGTATVAQARDHVTFSIGANIAPGVVLGATNAPYYYGPAYGPAYVPAPAYVAPAPVYYQPAPAYYDYGYAAAPVVGIRYYWSPAHRATTTTNTDTATGGKSRVLQARPASLRGFFLC
jgi:hypothetical protein